MRIFSRQPDNNSTTSEKKIIGPLSSNIREMKQLFSYDINKDFSLRTLTTRFNKKEACIFYYGSIVDGERINLHIIKPLLENEGDEVSNIVSIENIEKIKEYEKVVQNINSGKAFCSLTEIQMLMQWM